MVPRSRLCAAVRTGQLGKGLSASRGCKSKSIIAGLSRKKRTGEKAEERERLVEINELRQLVHQVQQREFESCVGRNYMQSL